MNSEQKRIALQVLLFIATFVTTTLAGSSWVYGADILDPGRDYTWTDFVSGMEFSVPLLLILTVHEFGHYFAAMFHKVKSSLPYFIPVPPGLPFMIGTMGAVIRLRSRPASNVQHFDIGVAGPLAGFVVALAFLIYGVQTLPPAEHIYEIHPEYKKFGLTYADSVYRPEFIRSEYAKVIKDTTGKKLEIPVIKFGQSAIFWLAGKMMDEPARMPNGYELMHFPILSAVFVGLLITAMNLLPIGQLDGGHIVYGLFGEKKHAKIAGVFFIGLLFYAGIGLPWVSPAAPVESLLINIPLYVWFLFACLKRFDLATRDRIMIACLIFAVQFSIMFFFPSLNGYSGWLLFAFIIGRFLGVRHPPSLIEQPLDSTRVIIGWIALIVFVLCVIPAPISVEII